MKASAASPIAVAPSAVSRDPAKDDDDPADPPPGIGGADATVEEIVAFLRQPDSYHPPATRVETRETHFSWVFLTDKHAYKLKKRLQRGDLNYGSLRNRRGACEEELRLNQRLAPGVYLDMLPVVRSSAGALRLGGSGRVLDWLVMMRRLPDDRMLDRAIACGAATDFDASRVGTRLADYYRSAPLIALPLAAYLRELESELHLCQQELLRPELGLSTDAVCDLTNLLLTKLAEQPWMFEERAGSIVEAHGDLRPEHICLVEPPLIIDRLEFDRRLRILDAASELTFLWLECERLGNARFGRLVFERYCRIANDHPGRRLIEFYRQWHACVRARLAVGHLRDASAVDHDKWRVRGEEYLRLGSAPLDGPAFWFGG